MRLFESQAIFNAETGLWEESYFIDEEEVLAEEYFEQQELEVKLEKLKEKKCCGCDICDCDEEISIGELIDYYVRESQEGCQCSDCMRQLFLEFTNDLLSGLDSKD